MCVTFFFLFRFSFSWRSRRCKTLLYDSAADNTQRHAPMRAPSLICTLPGRRVRQLCDTSAQFAHQPNTFDRPHRYSGGLVQLWKGRGVTQRDFDAKAWPEAWERDLSSADAGIDSDNSADVTRKMYTSLASPQSTFSFLTYPFPSHAMNTQPTLLAPLNNPTPERAFTRRTMTRTTTRGPRPARYIPHAHRYICSPPRASPVHWARRDSRFCLSGER